MLRDCFGPCFRLMLRLPDSPPTGRTDVRREAERLLEEAGRLALHGREAATVETARRMVEAWMDETALGIAWEGRAAWLGNPLQRRWRTGRSGGDWFFDEIRRLSPHRAEDAELAEVALRCLGFGFRGHFYNDRSRYWTPCANGANSIGNRHPLKASSPTDTFHRMGGAVPGVPPAWGKNFHAPFNKKRPAVPHRPFPHKRDTLERILQTNAHAIGILIHFIDDRS